MGRLIDAQHGCERGLAIANRINDGYGQSIATHQLELTMILLDDPAHATACHDRSASIGTHQRPPADPTLERALDSMVTAAARDVDASQCDAQGQRDGLAHHTRW